MQCKQSHVCSASPLAAPSARLTPSLSTPRPSRTAEVVPLSFILRPSPKDPDKPQGVGPEVGAAGEGGGLPCERALLQEAIQADEGSVWIAKPSSGGKGEGIVIARSYEELVACVDGSTKPKEVFLVQR